MRAAGSGQMLRPRKAVNVAVSFREVATVEPGVVGHGEGGPRRPGGGKGGPGAPRLRRPADNPGVNETAAGVGDDGFDAGNCLRVYRVAVDIDRFAVGPFEGRGQPL